MHPTRANVLVCKNNEAVAREAAEQFTCAAVRSAAQRGEFHAAVPGGWSPRGMYKTLATAEFASAVPWSQTQIFFTDERCVPPDHEESNYKLATDLLLAKVPIPDSNIHRFLAELAPDEAAERYGQELRKAMGDTPRLDLVVLGMGKDTHTASLFPHSPALSEMRALAVANYVKNREVHRLTLTIPVLCRAETILILALGYEKSGPLRQVLQGEHDPERHPVQAIQPAAGRLLWIVDQDAASKL